MLTCDDCNNTIRPAEVATRGTLHLHCWIMRTLRPARPVGGTLTERLNRRALLDRIANAPAEDLY